MRVIAGSARGRRLQAPPGRDARPTSDRVREALFSSLAGEVPGARVLDLFAGSGALAIEALSRGAAHAVLVERDRRAAAVIERNLRATGVAERARLRRSEAATFCDAPAGGPFDLVFLDPPYATAGVLVVDLLARLARSGALAPDAVAVVERPRRNADLAAELPGFLEEERRRTYGDTVLVYVRVQEEPSP